MSFRPPDLSHVPLPILLEDPRFVVVDKPSGLLSVPAKDPTVTDHVQSRVRRRYPSAEGPISVHRLDMETSGVLVCALDADAHRDLSIQFQDKVVKKRYLAEVDGVVPGDEGRIELPIRLDVDRRPYQIVDPVHGRAASTAWRVLSRRGGSTRLELTPLTGRTHQLRVHCASGLGCPILGDRLYGDPSTADRLRLHASWLRFEHPSTYQPVEVTAPAPF